MQRDEVKELITQVEYKIATESKKVSAAEARGQNGFDRESVAERQLASPKHCFGVAGAGPCTCTVPSHHVRDLQVCTR